MNKIIYLVFALAYVLLLKWAYIYIISPDFTYMGYSYSAVGLTTEALTTVFCVLPALWMPAAVYRPSLIIYWLMYVVVYIPANIFPYYSLAMSDNEILPLSATLFCSFALIGWIYHWEPRDIPQPKVGSVGFWIGIMAVWSLLNSLAVSVFGFNLKLHSLSEVYEVHDDFKSGLIDSGVGRFVGYAVAWLGHVINPLLMTVGFLDKRILLLTLGFGGQAFLFSITGHKSMLLNFLLIIAIFFALNKGGRNFGLWVLTGVTSVVGLGIGLAILAESTSFASLFIRRMLVTPGLLTGFYYEYFSTHPKALLSHSVLAPFVASNYNDAPSLIIGSVYFHNTTRVTGTNANANVWADAFANFGIPGILIFSLALALVLYLIDCLAKRRNLLLSAAVVGLSGFSFNSSAFLSCLLTHGVLLSMLILWLVPMYESPSITPKPGVMPPTNPPPLSGPDVALLGERP